MTGGSKARTKRQPPSLPVASRPPCRTRAGPRFLPGPPNASCAAPARDAPCKRAPCTCVCSAVSCRGATPAPRPGPGGGRMEKPALEGHPRTCLTAGPGLLALWLESHGSPRMALRLTGKVPSQVDADRAPPRSNEPSWPLQNQSRLLCRRRQGAAVPGTLAWGPVLSLGCSSPTRGSCRGRGSGARAAAAIRPAPLCFRPPWAPTPAHTCPSTSTAAPAHPRSLHRLVPAPSLCLRT